MYHNTSKWNGVRCLKSKNNNNTKMRWGGWLAHRGQACSTEAWPSPRPHGLHASPSRGHARGRQLGCVSKPASPRCSRPEHQQKAKKKRTKPKKRGGGRGGRGWGWSWFLFTYIYFIFFSPDDSTVDTQQWPQYLEDIITVSSYLFCFRTDICHDMYEYRFLCSAATHED